MLNHATILGRLGKDPESRTLPNGRAVVNFSLATSERWKDKESGEQREQTEWHNCVAYGRVGEVVVQYANKGELLLVQGKIQTRKWTDKKDVVHYSTEINVRDVTLMPKGTTGKVEGAKAGAEEHPFDDQF